MKSVFFWSEEHANDYRHKVDQKRGTYFTLAQSAYLTSRVQGALFAFP